MVWAGHTLAPPHRIDGIDISCSIADQNTFLQLLLVMIKASKRHYKSSPI